MVTLVYTMFFLFLFFFSSLSHPVSVRFVHETCVLSMMLLGHFSQANDSFVFATFILQIDSAFFFFFLWTFALFYFAMPRHQHYCCCYTLCDLLGIHFFFSSFPSLWIPI